MANYIDTAMGTYLPRRRKINIDPAIGFGLEIENNGLLQGKQVYDAERLLRKVDPSLIIKDDISLSIVTPQKTIETGLEIVTPVMHNKKDDLEMLKRLSNQLKIIKPKYDLSSFQINLDDDLREEQRLYLLKLYTLFEPVIARFCRGNATELREGVNNYAEATYYKIVNCIYGFKTPEEIVKEFSDNKRYAINFKKKNKNLIEFRLPNGTGEYTIWFNYINMFCNLLKSVKEQRLDPDYLDILLKKKRDNFDRSYITNYRLFDIDEELLESFLFYIFETEIDKLYFTQQYLGEDYKSLKKAQ